MISPYARGRLVEWDVQRVGDFARRAMVEEHGEERLVGDLELGGGAGDCVGWKRREDRLARATQRMASISSRAGAFLLTTPSAPASVATTASDASA
jgi:hypothetical protein